MATLRNVLLSASLVFAHVAGAWDASSSFNTGLPTDFTPSALAKPDAMGFWAVGRADNARVLVRYDNNATPQFVRYVQYQPADNDASIVGLADGGVIVRGLEGFATRHCVLRRYDAAGNLRWSSSAPEPDGFVDEQSCAPFTVDGADGVWIGYGDLYRIGSDGAIESHLATDGVAVLVGDPAAADVYAVGNAHDAGVGTIPFVQKIAADGSVLWDLRLPQSAGTISLHVADTGTDGSLYAFGEVSLGSGKGVYGVKVSPSGQIVWQHTDASAAISQVEATAATPDGNALVLFDSGQPGARGLSRTTADGTFAWTATPDLDRCFPPLLRAAVNGDAVLAAACTTQDDPNELRLQRFSATGSKTLATIVQHAWPLGLQVLPDSSSVLIDDLIPLVDANGMSLTPGGIALDRNLADGSLRHPAIAGLATALDSTRAVVFGNDGSAYLLVTDTADEHAQLSRIAPDGQVLWRQSSSEGLDQFYGISLVLAGGAVCVIESSSATCHATTNGTQTASFELHDGNGPPAGPGIARGLDNGQLLIVFQPGDAPPHVVLINTAGTLVHDTMLPYGYLNFVSVNGSGSSLIATGGSGYASFAADGTQRYSHADDGSGTIEQTYMASDGSGLLLTTSGTSTQLAHVDASGAVTWTRPITQTPPNPSQPYNFAGSIRESGNVAYLVLEFRGDVVVADDALLHFPYVIEKISLQDGNVAWSKTVDGILFDFPSLQLDASAQHLAAVFGWPDKLRTQVFNTADGGVLDDRFDACDADACSLLAAAVGSDGALRALVDASDDNGTLQREFTRTAPFAPRAQIRLDQMGVDGAWFAPYASGQGFTLDYIASAQTLFMPWFTYTTDGRNAPDGLAWYALQGTIDAGATSGSLAITTPDPSAFASGAVGVRVVGNAHLSFADCNAGTLLYQFNADVNGGAGGLISLTRLTPSSSACTLADGSVLAAQSPNVPALGFDANQSGSWFDPATSGQGLEITVQPTGGGSNGLLFAAWFTFDPANQSDDAAHRHWFTLQGDLANAAAGKATVPILRTIGGTLDGTPTGNTLRVGQATLTFTACDSAQLDYQFDRSDVAHAFAGLSGSIKLSRLGGCPAQ